MQYICEVADAGVQGFAILLKYSGLYAPKSTINLSQLANGVYFVVHSMDGQVVGTHKVIVNH